MNPLMPPLWLTCRWPPSVPTPRPKPYVSGLPSFSVSGVDICLYEAGLTTLPLDSASVHVARSVTVEHSEPAAYGCVMLNGSALMNPPPVGAGAYPCARCLMSG